MAGVTYLGPYPDDDPIYKQNHSTIMLIGRLTDGQKKLLNAIAQDGNDDSDKTEEDIEPEQEGHHCNPHT